ncbi:hypothetical protein NBE98_08535 [Clostridium swellfunianum]|uniref:hypothetical protein n=1 Tax=Clostridium swellfunianum TaxID=1367462 RepID=UPI00202FD9DE|nr:hypothetical protein [Clostridium swellfunianum]MCM0648419.1 hypothetical protein [Clostridium swellfunianum]
MGHIENYSAFYKWIEGTNIDPQREIPCIRFLWENGLSSSIETYVADINVPGPTSLYGIPVNRAARTTKDNLEKIKKSAGKREIDADRVWNDYKNIKDIMVRLDYERMPADAIAFYRPFHFEPFDEWGIYIYIDKLLEYCRNIVNRLGNSLFLFSDLRDVMSFVLFEIFHHEFFHHIVESAATTIEIITANSREEAVPYYIDYLRKKYHTGTAIGKHPDDPIEEALANAYAYNSFSFISRVKFGYKSVAVNAYQKVIKKVWKNEPNGYCYAEKYIDSGYKNGSTLLLSQILYDLNYMTPETIGLIAQSVLLKGHSAFMEKANIPVYLVGSEAILSEFYNLIPAPNETYTTLFMAREDVDIDKRLQEIKRINSKNKQNKS